MIVPAILESNPDIFADKLAAILSIPELKRIQIDISDGIFTSVKTLQLNELDILNPLYQWEAHLMVNNPEEYFLDAKIAGFNCLMVHFESLEKDQLKDISEKIKELKMSAGLAVKLSTPIAKIFEYVDSFEQVLILGVNPGFQGQKISPEIFERIKSLKKSVKNVKIEVDGGVDFANVAELTLAGAEILVAGSAIFSTTEGQSPSQNFELLDQASKLR